mmetsp:Transcript_76826/g.201568  ORF Transcript_76826/g.201568 Transcript_76826/m.201568 type:complete len:252 (-) Transcript_76826:207-962(-)
MPHDSEASEPGDDDAPGRGPGLRAAGAAAPVQAGPLHLVARATEEVQILELPGAGASLRVVVLADALDVSVWLLHVDPAALVCQAQPENAFAVGVLPAHVEVLLRLHEGPGQLRCQGGLLEDGRRLVQWVAEVVLRRAAPHVSPPRFLAAGGAGATVARHEGEQRAPHNGAGDPQDLVRMHTTQEPMMGGCLCLGRGHCTVQAGALLVELDVFLLGRRKLEADQGNLRLDCVVLRVHELALLEHTGALLRE